MKLFSGLFCDLIGSSCWGTFQVAKENPGQTPSNTRFQIGNYFADIFLDSRQQATIYHWIVQRVGSAEILSWGQEESFEAAESAARSCLVHLDVSSRQKNA